MSSPTSILAASAIRGASRGQRGRVLDSLGDAGPATADELSERLSLRIDSVRPRLAELERAGQVVKLKFNRATRSGRAANVWAIPGDARGSPPSADRPPGMNSRGPMRTLGGEPEQLESIDALPLSARRAAQRFIDAKERAPDWFRPKLARAFARFREAHGGDIARALEELEQLVAELNA
jgi:predicted ArsR family transcriptional regulator